MSTTPTLLDLIDAYAEARHTNGDSTYNATTKAARDAVVAALTQGAGAVEPVAWMHDTPGRVEVIHAEVKKLLRDCNDSISHLHRPIDKSTRYTIPLYDAQQLQQAVARTVEECAVIADRYAMALDDGNNPYLRSRECQQAAAAIRAKGTHQ